MAASAASRIARALRRADACAHDLGFLGRIVLGPRDEAPPLRHASPHGRRLSHPVARPQPLRSRHHEYFACRGFALN